MSAFDPNPKKTKLLGVLQASEAADSAILRDSLEAVEAANTGLEINRSLQEVVRAIPDDSALPSSSWGQLTSAWDSHFTNSKAFASVTARASTFSATTFSASLSTSLAFVMATPWMATPPVAPKLAALDATLHRAAKVSDARAQLTRLGLNSAPSGSRSPMELLDEAEAARTRPSSGGILPTGILIPLRECIEATLAALLQRRPSQVATGKTQSKVTSIGDQCGLPNLPPHHFHNLGVECAKLVKDLSGSKQATMDPKRMNAHFDAGIFFLTSFLGSIDGARLRV
jgi:hypothetical protein